MRKIIFIFSILLSSLCASLAQGQTYTVTWKVNGVQFAQNQTKNGKINLEDIDDPYIEGDLEFAGWTAYESYSDFDAPDDIFDYFSDDEDLPTIASNSTFYAVFAEFDDEIEEYFNYTTDYLEDLIFITNDTVISLEDAIAERILFIKNKDERIENIILGSESFSPDWGIAQPKYNSTNQGTFLTRITSPGDYWIEFSTIEDWRYRQVIKKHISFKVRDNCTVKYVDFDDNWCPETTSRGGKYKLGSTFRISPSLPNDPQGLNRELIYWNTNEEGNGRTYQIGEEIIINDDITLYPQWKWEINTTCDAINELKNTDVVLNPYGNLFIARNSKVIIKSLTLQGGLDFEFGGYCMPSLYVTKHNKTALQKNNINDIVNFDLSINSNNYYPFAVPFPVAVNDIDYADSTLASASTYGTHYVIKRYDGAARAINGEDRNGNWVVVDTLEILQPGVGYIITALPVDGKAIIRIPLHFDNKWTLKGEAESYNGITRNIVPTTAHSGTAANSDKCHAGWNFIANPYLAKYDGSQIQNAPEYASIPTYNFSEYQQVPLSDVTLSPEYPFFVQVNSNTELNFATEGRKQAPAAMRTSDDKLRTKLTITQHNHNKTDQTSIILGDSYSPAYEINADLEKMFGSAYTTAIYTCSQNTRLAFNALSWKNATSPIPLGYRAAEVGEYTIALDNIDDLGDIASVNLHDAYTNQTINLLYFDYTFTSEVTQDDSRFTIQITSKNNTTTDIDSLIVPTTTTTKIIHNNQLYIIRDGQKYNAIGQAIK